MMFFQPRVDATRMKQMFTFKSSDTVLIHKDVEADCTTTMSVLPGKLRHLERTKLQWTGLKLQLLAS